MTKLIALIVVCLLPHANAVFRSKQSPLYDIPEEHSTLLPLDDAAIDVPVGTDDEAISYQHSTHLTTKNKDKHQLKDKCGCVRRGVIVTCAVLTVLGSLAGAIITPQLVQDAVGCPKLVEVEGKHAEVHEYQLIGLAMNNFEILDPQGHIMSKIESSNPEGDFFQYKEQNSDGEWIEDDITMRRKSNDKFLTYRCSWTDMVMGNVDINLKTGEVYLSVGNLFYKASERVFNAYNWWNHRLTFPRSYGDKEKVGTLIKVNYPKTNQATYKLCVAERHPGSGHKHAKILGGVAIVYDKRLTSKNNLQPKATTDDDYA